MRTITKKKIAAYFVLCAIAAVFFALLDAYALLLWLYEEQLKSALLLHLAVSVSTALLGYAALPSGYRTKKRELLLLLITALAIPVFGSLAVTLSVVYSLRIQPAEQTKDWQLLPKLQLPAEPVAVNFTPIYVYSGLAAVLNRFTSIELKHRALLATKNMSSRKALPVIMLGLNDEVDEIRLLAYTMLNKKQTTLENAMNHIELQLHHFKIKNEKKQMAVCYEELAIHAQEIASIHKKERLSFMYWMTSAHESVVQAIKMEDNARRQYLYAKILMQLGHLDEAGEVFEYCEALGYPLAKIAPYRAEVAYLKGDSSAVIAHINRARHYLLKVPAMRPVVEYWQ